jgi:hypothetical protein
VLLGVAAVFLGLAIVFGAIAFFRITAQPASGQPVSSPMTFTVTPSAAGTSGVAAPTPAVTLTTYIEMPPSGGGSDVGAIETAASTLASVVAAVCAVIVLRPPAKARPAAAAPPPAGRSPA